MTSEEPLSDRCGAKCRDGGYCESYPVGDGDRCRMHGGTTPTKDENPNVGKGSEDQEENDRAVRHNMLSDESLLYKRLPESYQDLVDGWKRHVRADIADAQGYATADDVPSYFDPVIHRLAMNMLRITMFAEDWQAGDEMKDDVDNPLVDRSVIDRTESGEPLFQYSESTVEKAASRMSRENRQWLKDLDIIGSDGADDDGMVTLAQAIKNAAERID